MEILKNEFEKPLYQQTPLYKKTHWLIARDQKFENKSSLRNLFQQPSTK